MILFELIFVKGVRSVFGLMFWHKMKTMMTMMKMMMMIIIMMLPMM